MFPKFIGLGLLCLARSVMASDTALDTGNTAWILTATALVLFMTLPGLALFYDGKGHLKSGKHDFGNIACHAVFS